MSLAAQEYRILYFEEPIFVADVAPHLESMARGCQITIARPTLPKGIDRSYATDLQRQLLEQELYSKDDGKLLFWYYTPAALEFTRHLTPAICVFDNMDDLASFRGASPSLRMLEKEILATADIVFTGGQSLFESKQHLHDNVHAFPSSIDRAHFAAARTFPKPEPPDQACVDRPRLGFFGVIDERMDLGLLTRIADLRPSWQFIMLGPLAKIDPVSLPRRHNIHWLGAKSYRDLPAYLAGWELGFMPFALNEATRFISPTKTPEFLAAGIPVLSTPIRDVIRPYGELGLVKIVQSADELVNKAKALLREDHGGWLARVDAHLRNMSWTNTWKEMQAIISTAGHVSHKTGNVTELADV